MSREAAGKVAGTASGFSTHRHTIRYRLERVRDLTGLDVSSTDGREKLGLGLKAMRVLGIAAPRGPATEAGAGGGGAPRGPKDRESGRAHPLEVLRAPPGPGGNGERKRLKS